MRSFYRIFAGVLLLAGMLAGGRAYGQGGATGAISGLVVDTSGGSIADAEVQVIEARTETVQRKLSTNTDGVFVATLLPPGTYSVVVNK
ncbi:MAG: carboxypeptidase-like regulatory domain-containing protein, partial [Candidatus Acidiferrum sp.]